MSLDTAYHVVLTVDKSVKSATLSLLNAIQLMNSLTMASSTHFRSELT